MKKREKNYQTIALEEQENIIAILWDQNGRNYSEVARKLGFSAATHKISQ